MGTGLQARSGARLRALLDATAAESRSDAAYLSPWRATLPGRPSRGDPPGAKGLRRRSRLTAAASASGPTRGVGLQADTAPSEVGKGLSTYAVVHERLVHRCGSPKTAGMPNWRCGSDLQSRLPRRGGRDCKSLPQLRAVSEFSRQSTSLSSVSRDRMRHSRYSETLSLPAPSPAEPPAPRRPAAGADRAPSPPRRVDTGACTPPIPGLAPLMATLGRCGRARQRPDAPAAAPPGPGRPVAAPAGPSLARLRHGATAALALRSAGHRHRPDRPRPRAPAS